jgi:hypothetical protein
MINYDLINENIIHALAAIKNIEPTPCPGIWQIKNIFNENLLGKLQNHLDTVSDDCWSMVEGQENRSRRKLTWQADTVIEEMHEICSGLTDYINKRFSDFNKNFLGISIWKDQQGYTMSWHQDNPIIDIGMQIFLFDRVSPEYGTVFKIDEKEYLVPYISNTGYIIVQNQQLTTLHKPAMPLASNQIRYSLYSVWSRSTKHSANP